MEEVEYVVHAININAPTLGRNVGLNVILSKNIFRAGLKLLAIMLQLADAKDVMKAIQGVEGARFPVLTPNLKVSFILWRN